MSQFLCFPIEGFQLVLAELFLLHAVPVTALAFERLNAVCHVTHMGLSTCLFTEIAEG